MVSMNAGMVYLPFFCWIVMTYGASKAAPHLVNKGVDQPASPAVGIKRPADFSLYGKGHDAPGTEE
jgi:hypothetical protein